MESPIVYSDSTVSLEKQFSTVTHVVKKQINILNERPRDISLVPIRDLSVYQSVNDVSVCYFK